jgi:hypothetical protein
MTRLMTFPGHIHNHKTSVQSILSFKRRCKRIIVGYLSCDYAIPSYPDYNRAPFFVVQSLHVANAKSSSQNKNAPILLS